MPVRPSHGAPSACVAWSPSGFSELRSLEYLPALTPTRHHDNNNHDHESSRGGSAPRTPPEKRPRPARWP
eukprot:14899329-Alexandrium_andersonii.AAC.1